MTILNVISALIFIAIGVTVVVLYRYSRKETEAAIGLGPVNERGEIGTSHEGDIVISIDLNAEEGEAPTA